MTLPASHRDQKPGWMLVLSLLLHLVIIFIFSRAQLFRADLQEAPAYYVDLISLPTADPAPGTPPSASTPPPAAPLTAPSTVTPPPSAAKPAMSVPLKTPSAPAQKSSPATPSTEDASSQEAREFNERLRRLEHSSEARHQAAALESLQKKAATTAKGGGPSSTGTTPGSDYAAYIQSRLKDALATTMVYRSTQPEAAVHLYIDKKGKLLRYVMIRPSTDKLFNDSVMRTIEKAKATFPPTPSGADFDKLYVFSPQEVNRK